MAHAHTLENRQGPLYTQTEAVIHTHYLTASSTVIKHAVKYLYENSPQIHWRGCSVLIMSQESDVWLYINAKSNMRIDEGT